MLNFILSTESAADLTQKQANELGVSLAPMTFFINGEEHHSDTTTLTTKDICNKMRMGESTKTTQLNEAEIEEYLTGLLSLGKDILHISFSSAMSGTCSNFMRVADKLNKSNDNKIYVVDSLCQCCGLGLLVHIVSQKSQAADFSANDAYEYTESIKQSIGHFFIVDDLKYLARGGRISSSTALIGNIIKIKPVLHLDNTGTITQMHKVLGRKKSITTLIDTFKKYYNNESKYVYISEADCLEDATYLKNKLLEIDSTLSITINPLGPIIASHSGPGTMALFFTSHKR